MRAALVYLPALLGLAFLALWPLSYRWGVSWGLPWDRLTMVGMCSGQFVYWSADKGEAPRWEVYRPGTEPIAADWIEQEQGPFTFRVGPFAWGRFVGGGLVAVRSTIATVPIWFPAFLLLLPILWRTGRRLRQRAGRGFDVVNRG